jgi:hypothetical protein
VGCRAFCTASAYHHAEPITHSRLSAVYARSRIKRSYDVHLPCHGVGRPMTQRLFHRLGMEGWEGCPRGGDPTNPDPGLRVAVCLVGRPLMRALSGVCCEPLGQPYARGASHGL